MNFDQLVEFRGLNEKWHRAIYSFTKADYLKIERFTCIWKKAPDNEFNLIEKFIKQF